MTGWCGPGSSRSGQGSVRALFYPVHRGIGACTQEVTACFTLASLPSLADQVVLKVVNHPRCTPDLAPDNFSPFGTLRKHLALNKLAADAHVTLVVTSWLQTVHTGVSSPGVTVGQMLVCQW
jgi:hypothetical protein